MRDHIDGVESTFLPFYYRLKVQPYRYGNPEIHELFITDDLGGITLGAYRPRSIFQRPRYRLWCSPEEITDFFDLEFDDFLRLYRIEDEETMVLAKLRWS